MSSDKVKTAHKTIALVGLPNTGKSQLFSKITGVYSLVANYSRTTIEEKRATLQIGNETVEIIDTPGLHGLYIHSEEELAVRDLLYSQPPDILIQCVDANHLKQSLPLMTDLLELGIPMVVCLNAMDDTARNGTWIDTARIEERLGVPVIETIAQSGSGIDELLKSLTKARPGKRSLHYGDIVENGVMEISRLLEGSVEFPRETSLLLLKEDPFAQSYVNDKVAEEKRPKIEERVADLRRKFDAPLDRHFLDQRARWVDDFTDATVRKRKLRLGSQTAERFAHLSRHPFYGIPIFLLFLLSTFLMVVYVAGFVEGKLNDIIVDPSVTYLTTHLPEGFWADFLVGHYGILTLGVFNAFCTVLPILGAFFLVLSCAEDIGYIPNLCVLTGRLFEKLGLSGKSIMSLVLAFGCKTMATLTTKGLPSYKEKFIANYLIAFTIPCGAQMALQVGILGRVGPVAFLLTFGVMMSALVVVGIALNKILPEGDREGFIQELPPARFPSPKAVLVKTYYRLRWFLQEAVPIFLIAALALFALEKTGLLQGLKVILHPIVVGWLGLSNEMVDVLLLCVARHEVAAGRLLDLVDTGILNTPQTIVSVLLLTMFVPCSAHVLAIGKQMGLKTACIMIPCLSLSALLLTGTLNYIFKLFWTGA